jgi:hypothetical protein
MQMALHASGYADLVPSFGLVFFLQLFEYYNAKDQNEINGSNRKMYGQGQDKMIRFEFWGKFLAQQSRAVGDIMKI